MQKRGQAALEFLMTYGWAMLAVLITIAALAYFGVLNPARFLPESCNLFPGIACTDFSANNVGVAITVQNGLGQSLNPFTLSISGCTSVQAISGLSDGEKEVIVLPCNPSLVTNSKFKNDIDVTYTATSVSHTRKGSISTAVENGYTLNGGFESGLNYWIENFAGSSVIAFSGIDSTQSYSGSNSYKIQVTVDDSGNVLYPNIKQILDDKIIPNSGLYTISFYVKSSSPGNMGFSLRTTTNNPAFLPTCTDETGIPVTTSWTRIIRTCDSNQIAPDQISYIELQFGVSANTIWVDNVEIKKV